MEVIGLTVRVHDPRGKSPRYPLQVAGWAPGAGLDLLENSKTLLVPALGTPDRPDRSLVSTDYAIPASLFKVGGQSNPPP
jgi:hypothetical protein